MTKRPYVGVTGFMSRHEVLDALDAFDAIQHNNVGQYLLMAGILVSTKTLHGRTNRYPGRYPKIDQMPSILFPDPRVLWLIHFHSDQPELLLGELKEVTQRAGEHCHGVQLNVAWPEPYMVQDYWHWLSARQANPRVVLQIGPNAMREVRHDARELTDRLSTYAASGIITDVLIDPSAGTGQPFDPEIARKYLITIHDACPDLGLGIAGGLCRETLGLLKPLIPILPHLNIDAEGRLRNKENDSLNLEWAREYAQAALRMLQQL